MKKPTYYKLTLVVLFLMLLSFSGVAQTYQPWTVRGNVEVKGSMLVVGNNILGLDNLPNNDDSIDNDMVVMQYIDIDSDASTFSSSSADLVLQPHEDGTPTTCYAVAYAALYWGAVLQSGDRSNITSVKFKTPENTSYTDINGTLIYDAIVDPIISEDGEPGNTPYACYADVTSLLQNLTDIEGSYTMANVVSSEGTNYSTGLSAGWTLFVIYEDPYLHTKSFTTFDGFSHIYNDHYLEVPVDGFTTPPAGHIDLQFAYATLDGDKTKKATKLEINNKEVTTPFRSANKFFGSIIENYNGIAHPRNPFGTNTLGYDTGMLEIFNSEPEYIVNGATDASFTLQVARGQADPIFAFFSAFAVDVISPEIELVKTVEDEFGNDINGDDVILGQNLFYEISYQNTGNEDITNFTITDVLPENIIFDPFTDIDYTNAGGATLLSYDPITRTIVFSVPDESVEFDDPIFTIRIAVQVVPNCYDLSQACSNEVINQAFGTYTGAISSITIEEQASYVILECNSNPQPTNFLVDISNCNFERDEVLCGDSIILTAADGYDSYSWSTSPTGAPVIGTSQTFTATEVGTYYVTNTAAANCISIEEVINVLLYGVTQTNPIIPFADVVSICPNDGKELPKIFLCGINDTRDILTGISDATSIVWEQLDESSCDPIGIDDCANENSECTWNQVGTGPNFTANASGQFRIVINYPGGCFSVFYFNVYQNLLDPTAVAQDIICNTPGQITVYGVPNGYEYSIDGVNFQSSNIFTVTSPGYYTIYIQQIGIDTNPCIFQTPAVHVRERDFTVTSNVTQPECYGEFGSINIAVNDALPQYYFSVYQGATLIDSVGPTMDSDYAFTSLNAGIYTINVSTDDGCFYTEDIEIIAPPLLTVTAAITTPLTCVDGEITVYPEGGTPPYIYYVNSTTDFQTSPIIIVETAGVYNITVVDTYNCSANTVVTVEAISPPDFNVTQSNILCTNTSNGSITINVTNSNGNALQYSIDGGLTFFNSSVFIDLPEGSYDVVVQYTIGSAVCVTDPQTITITAAPPLSGTAILDAPYTCTNDASITVTGVTGGTPPYTYSLDGITFQTNATFTDLTAGTYTITIQDTGGCTTIINSITIDPLNPPTDLTFSNSPLTCPSNTSTITITSTIGGIGALEYQIIAPTSAATPYQASNVFSGLSPDTYTFQVMDSNDCVYSESYTIDPLPTLIVNTILTEDLDCTASPDAIITGTISGGTPPYTYSVSINGNTYSTLGATGSSFTYATSNPGTYQFEITDANGCISESMIHSINPITPPILSLLVQTEPILCNGDSNGAINITIDPTVGTPPFAININNDTSGTNYGTQTSGLPSGTYTITLTDAKSCTATNTITIDEPDPMLLNYHIVDITCTLGGASQGSIIIDGVTGGTAPYNYFVSGTNGYSNSEINASGTSSVSFDVVDFGLYQINVVDANGCSVLVQNILVASPPTDLDILINTTVDCLSGGEAVVSIGTTLSSTGPFFFSIYQGPISVYPNPPGSWIPEDSPGSETATFTGLTPGVIYTFIVYDASTDCSYYEPATTPIPTNSTLTASAVSSNNINCSGSADGNVSFTVNSIYGTSTNINYEIFDSLTLASTGISGSGTVPAAGSLIITDLGPLPIGNYYVLISETSGPNSGCGIVTVPFNITESAILLSLSTSIDQNANCNANSGLISVIGQNGTAPYQYQITTTATAPLATDPSWSSASTFNMDTGNYYIHVLDSYGCIMSSPVIVLPIDPTPVISANLSDQCTTLEGAFEIDVTLSSIGIPPYSFSINGGAFQTQVAPFTISNLFSGTHTVEITDANGCGNLVSVNIAPPLGLTPEITLIPTCNNDDGEITLTGSGGTGSYSYTISPNPASISLSGNVFSGVPSGIYTITMTDVSTSCSEDVTISLPGSTPPMVSTTPTSVICFGDTSIFEINVSGYSGSYNYEVFDSLGTSITGTISANTSTNPEIVSGILAGNYDVVITETASPFCVATSSVIITSPAEALTLIASETSNVTCDNNQGTITSVADGGWGNYEYELTGTATVGYSPSGTFTNLEAGSYTINVRDSEGCIASENVTLFLPTPIDATFAPNTTLLSCFGDQNATITVTNVTGGQGNNYTYTLNTIAPTPSTSGPQTSNVFGGLGAGTYSITITDGFACDDTSINIIIDQPTSIEASLVTATTQTCLSETTLTLSASGGTGPYMYSDSSAFTTILGSFSTSITFSVPIGSYAYYVRDTNGCVANASNEIIIDPIPQLTLNLTSSNPIINCVGDNTGVITAIAQGGLGNYVYTLQDTMGNIISAVQNSPGVFTELVAGNYVVYVDSGDCNTSTSTITITEPTSQLDVSYIVNDVTCSGSNNGSIEIIASGGTGIIKYAISPQLNQFFETNIFENLAPGNYDVIVQDVLGCYETFNFTISEPIPVIISIVPNSILEEVCDGDGDGEFSIDVSGGTTPYSVSLDDYNGEYTVGTSGQTQFDFIALGGGDHMVYVRDDEGCESEWNITFPESVRINPIVVIEYNCVNNISSNTVTVIVDDSITDPADLDYSLNGGPYQASNVFTDVIPGTNHYIDVRHTNSCIQSTEFFEIPQFEPVTIVLNEGELNEIIAVANGGFGDYQFTFNGEDYEGTNTFIISESGEYTVTVTDSSGCIAMDTIFLEFIDVCIPNYFTPNDDGVTDDWAPGCTENYPNLVFSIFDRYGRKIATLGIGEKWDGKYNNKELPTGDYWYVVKLNSSTNDHEFVGHFTLYR